VVGRKRIPQLGYPAQQIPARVGRTSKAEPTSEICSPRPFKPQGQRSTKNFYVVCVKIQYPNSPKDPAGWTSAATSASVVYDALEPLEPIVSEYRQCALSWLAQLCSLDQWMCQTHSGLPPRKWIAVSLAWGLKSTWGQSETEIARRYGVTRAAISKDVVAVLKFTGLEDQPAFGLKSAQNRQTYKRTNGRRRTRLETR
jgi:hypothetical protein